jgi:hypothetical protein
MHWPSEINFNFNNNKKMYTFASWVDLIVDKYHTFNLLLFMHALILGIWIISYAFVPFDKTIISVCICRD